MTVDAGLAAWWLSALLWASFNVALAGALLAACERWRPSGPAAYYAGIVLLARLLSPLPAPWNPEDLPGGWLWIAASGLWLAGFVAFGLRYAARTLAAHRTALLNECPVPEAASEVFVEGRRRIAPNSRPAFVATSAPLPAMALGWPRPTVVLSRRLAQGDRAALRHVVYHELFHCRQGDLPMNALWQLALSLHWFNPWIARLARRQRFHVEARCDAAACRALARGAGGIGAASPGRGDGRRDGDVNGDGDEDMERAAYSKTLLSMAATPATPDFAEGALCLAENDYGLGARVERLLSPPRPRQGWLAAGLAVLVVVAGAFAPRGTKATAAAVEPAGGDASAVAPAPEADRGKPGQNGGDRNNKPKKAKADKKDGEKKERPRIVRMDPPNGAENVDPETPLLLLRFDRPMGEGYSWAQRSDEKFPKSDEDSDLPAWLDEKTAVFAVRLEPEKSYELLLNIPPFTNFRSKDGDLPAEGVIYTFTTGKQSPDPARRDKIRARQIANAGVEQSDKPRPPRIQTMSPANGARDVDPNTPFLLVRFSQPMGNGRAWAQRSDESFPAIDKDYDGPMLIDERVALLPVRLEPNKEYEILLNVKPFVAFRSRDSGLASPGVRYVFKTGGQALDPERREALGEAQLRRIRPKNEE